MGCLLETPHPGFLLGLVTCAPSLWNIPVFQTPRRKVGVELNSLGTGSPSYWLRNAGTLLKFRFTDASQGLALQGGLSKESVSGLCV